MKQRFTVGDRVIMSNESLEKYGEEYDKVVLQVISVYRNPTKNMLYDTAVGQALYDLKRTDTQEFLRFSLYDWELE